MPSTPSLARSQALLAAMRDGESRYARLRAFAARLPALALCVLGQPLMVILVLCWSWAPFWPVRVVGIVSFVPQRPPCALAGRLAPRAEKGPWGSLSSKLEIGASGTALKVLVVMLFLMLVFPTRSSRTP